LPGIPFRVIAGQQRCRRQPWLGQQDQTQLQESSCLLLESTPIATCRYYQEKPMLALLETINLALTLYSYVIIASAIFSWLHAFNVINSSNHFVASIGEFLYRVTEPALRPIRRFIPDLGGIDISPIILLLIIFFLQRFLATTIAPALL
jgi:YggT family protein